MEKEGERHPYANDDQEDLEGFDEQEEQAD